MPTEVAVNGGTSTLSAPITASDTVIQIQVGDVGHFPTGSGIQYRIAISDATHTEICTVHGGFGSSYLSVSRATERFNGVQQAYAFAANASVEHVLTADALLSLTPPGPVGPAGPAGAAGAIGPQGATGAVGPEGAQGTPGIQGPVGADGPQGPRGLAGPEGQIGPVGPAGPVGADGVQGPAGATGVAGPAGPAGANGAVGATGAEGPAGPQGVAGADGAVGATGAQGIQGPVGPIGPAGLTWRGVWSAANGYVIDDAVSYGGASYFNVAPVAAGGASPDTDATHWALLAAQGAVGPQGPAGAVGAQGSVGPQGPAGVDGAVGPAGPQGLTGATGAVGPAGADGAQGIQGPAGPQGAVGAVGPAGAQGIQGVAGAVGPVGPQGPQGPVGPSTGVAGGVLSGNYPNPGFAVGPVFDGGLTLNTGALTVSAGNVVIANGSLIFNDTYLYRDAVNVIAQRSGAAAQTLRIYGTYTDAANYERLEVRAGNPSAISQTYAGSGVARDLYISTLGAARIVVSTNNVSRWMFDSAGHLITNADNTYDLGALGVNRPRNLYLGTNLVVTDSNGVYLPNQYDSFVVKPAGVTAFRVAGATNLANNVWVSAAPAGGAVRVATEGSSTDVPMYIQSKGAGAVYLGNNNFTVLSLVAPASAVNGFQFTATVAGGSPTLALGAGGDANLDFTIQAKGTGRVVLAAPVSGVTSLSMSGALSGLTAIYINGAVGSGTQFTLTGGGNTSATSSFQIVNNSRSVNNLIVRDDGLVTMAGAGGLSVTGTVTFISTSLVLGSNVFITNPSGYMVVQPTSDLYLRPGSGSSIRIDQGNAVIFSGPLSGISTLSMSGALTVGQVNATGLHSSTDWVRVAQNVGIYFETYGVGIWPNGSSTTLALYPSGDVICGLTTTQTLSNKTLSDPKLTGIATFTSGTVYLPAPVDGMIRFYKAWGAALTIGNPNSAIYGLYGPGYYGGNTSSFTIQNGDSVTLAVVGNNWFVF